MSSSSLCMHASGLAIHQRKRGVGEERKLLPLKSWRGGWAPLTLTPGHLTTPLLAFMDTCKYMYTCAHAPTHTYAHREAIIVCFNCLERLLFQSFWGPGSLTVLACLPNLGLNQACSHPKTCLEREHPLRRWHTHLRRTEAGCWHAGSGPRHTCRFPHGK